MSGAQVRLSGQLTVPLPPSQAFTLFTPRGEESWVTGWRPHFPAPTPDDTVPGTVFQTTAHDETTIWVVTDREQGRRIQYARITPGSRAGSVTVLLHDTGDGTTTVEVGYALTALTPDVEPDLHHFAADYPAFLTSWEDAIIAHLATA